MKHRGTIADVSAYLSVDAGTDLDADDIANQSSHLDAITIANDVSNFVADLIVNFMSDA